MHQALYRKWRPQTFDDVCGQEHITSILKYETEQGAFSHAYLFCGSRGTGKTTCAKILSKAVNCEHPVNGSPCGTCASCRSIDSGAATDVLEMDAASNNGVDNIRDIRDEVVYAPNALKYRVYIIDEVHMLSGSAFNALLKTLEEPPAHVVFVLATTELHKLPATIISRCQRFDFRRIATPVLRDRLLHIAKAEDITLDEDAATLLGKLAQGGMRDAISLLELCAGARRPITTALVNETVGLTGRDALLSTVRAIAARDYDALYARIDEVVQSSMDLGVFWQDLIAVYRDLLVVKTTKKYAEYLDLTDAEQRTLGEVAALFSKETILYHRQLLDQAYLSMQGANALGRVTAELTLIRMCDETLSTTQEALLSRIAKLEALVLSGGISHRAAVQETPNPEDDAPNDPAPVEPSGEPTQAAAIEPTATQSVASQAVPSKADDAGGKRVLRPIRAWSEVVERVTAQNPMAASFLGQARAYTEGERGVLVRFENQFAQMMIDQGDTKDMLRGALSVCLQREVREKDLVCEVLPAAKQASSLDEIIEALDEE
ncbi:MAG: DNA polymerase III subunit gamma/tau [Clostridia bacterium]|nr:DNA polymerase III subunit gamma/tau [Clostridia bacterium]